MLPHIVRLRDLGFACQYIAAIGEVAGWAGPQCLAIGQSLTSFVVSRLHYSSLPFFFVCWHRFECLNGRDGAVVFVRRRAPGCGFDSPAAPPHPSSAVGKNSQGIVLPWAG